jgi:hypothetical protein
MPVAEVPSQRARELVRGAYDLHVHVAPDVMARRITDLALSRRFAAVGLAGYVLKSHYVPTAERAAVLREAVPEVDALGAICLNAAVGGMNPLAVEIAAREEARIVWLPTTDAANHRATRHELPPGATRPMWVALMDDLAAKGMEPPPVAVVDEAGEPLAATRQVLELVAAHDLVLATGHLGREEILAVVTAAVDAGVRRILVTHPEFPMQNLPVDDQLKLTAQGAFLERCFTTPFTGKYDWSRLVANIRATGPEHTVLSTDLGQPHNPPVEDGLALFADALLDAGLSEEEVHGMAVENTRLLAAAPHQGGAAAGSAP